MTATHPPSSIPRLASRDAAVARRVRYGSQRRTPAAGLRAPGGGLRIAARIGGAAYGLRASAFAAWGALGAGCSVSSIGQHLSCVLSWANGIRTWQLAVSARTARTRVAIRLLGHAILVGAIPWALWDALCAPWWPTAVVAITTAVFLFFAMIQWATYREEIGRPLSISRYIPSDF